MARMLIKTGGCNFLTINRGSYRLRFRPASYAASMWIGGPGSWRQDENVLASLLRAGDTYVDVGANIGSLLLSSKAVIGQSGLAIGIEPHPRIFSYLAENVALNGLAARLHNVAIGASARLAVISDSVSDDMNSVRSAGEGLAVRVETLDSILHGVSRVDLLKIDVEGYELEVIRGGTEVLRRTSMIYFESWEEHAARHGYTTQELLLELTRNGFITFRLSSGKWSRVSDSYVSETCENLLAVHSELVEPLAGARKLTLGA